MCSFSFSDTPFVQLPSFTVSRASLQHFANRAPSRTNARHRPSLVNGPFFSFFFASYFLYRLVYSWTLLMKTNSFFSIPPSGEKKSPEFISSNMAGRIQQNFFFDVHNIFAFVRNLFLSYIFYVSFD